MSSTTSTMRTATQDFGTWAGSSDWRLETSRGCFTSSSPSQIAKVGKEPSSVARLFPSMHTLSKLNGIEDSGRYCGKITTHFDDDVGIVGQNSVYIGKGSQFEVRRVTLCCNRGFYVQKSALAIAYEERLSWRKSERRDEKKLIQALFLEYRALSHPPIREHPNIVDILDLGWETDPKDWIVKWPVLILEYADQGAMTAFLAQMKFSLETMTKLCLDIARGLTTLHDCGIIHGDLKMDNVLIFTNTGVSSGSINRYTAKLADFGASLVELDGTRLPSFTRPWNAPECFEKLDHTGLKKFDIYSFGLLCWAVILGGKGPFSFVAEHLCPDDWDSSMRLKKADNGSQLLGLARESFAQVFGHLNPPLATIDATLQLDPTKRCLTTAVAALEEFLEPLRTDAEAKALQEKTVSILDAPTICSHQVCLPECPDVVLNSQDLKKYRGPLKGYLIEWLQEHNKDSGLVEDPDSVARSLLAELELDDWLEGRSPDASQVIAQYRVVRPSFWERTIIYRLASLLPEEEFNEVVTTSLNDMLVEAFDSGFSPAQTDLFAVSPEWAANRIWFSLVCNGAGVLPALRPETVNILTAAEHSNVTDALQQAFPSIEIAPTMEDESRIGLSFSMDVDLANSVLDQDRGNSAVHILSQVGVATLLEQLLQIPGVDINARNRDLETPLLLACRAGRFATAMLLVKKGADVRLRNAYGENALHWIHSFHFIPDQMKELGREIMTWGSRELLRAEAEHRHSADLPEHRLFPGTPICRAIIKGRNEAALLLWDMERAAFAPQKPAYKAIIYAAQLHNHHLLDAFLEGPDDLVDPETGVSLLDTISAQNGSLSNSSIGRILRHGSNCRQSGVLTLKVLCKYGATDHFANVPGLPDCNFLSLAVRESSPEVVEFLLEEMDCTKFVNVDTPPPGISMAVARGESVKYGLENWKTSLLYLSMLADRPSIFKLLLEHGADVNRVLASEDGPLTTLHHAVTLSCGSTYVKMLLDTGKINDIDEAADKFESPFATAVRMRKFDIAQCLLDHGADVNRLALNGVRSFPEGRPAETVLGQVLVQESSLSSLACISFLLETGKASPYTNRSRNLTVLDCLGLSTSTCGGYNGVFVREAFKLLHNHFHFTKEILNARRNGDGFTAMELAVLNNKADLVEELILAGADWEVVEPNPMGHDSALVLAMKNLYHFPRGVAVEGKCPS
ncbi:hypothetical protein B0T10DRAFT_605779 [Thelonectria olida]|uniref:Protein kinase domain-containing protein n=1 Tax=Thelonectria olida TaxID=1576542 RepID=A0A9P9ARS8_9HYPO|nr:hypothetical protein B0T10DRAFT_605779 [Thelonectria olida]